MPTETQPRGLEELRARQTEIEDRLRAIHEEGGDEPLPEETQAEWDELSEELPTVRTDIERIEARRAQVLEFSGHATATEEPNDSPEVRTPEDPFDLDSLRVTPFADRRQVADQLRGRAVTAVESMRHVPDEHRERITQLLETVDRDHGNLAERVLQCGSPDYNRAFASYLAGRPLVGDEARALSVGTNSEGGFAVPVFLDPTIILTSDGSVNPLRQIARVETITTKEWQGVTSSGVTASYAAEADEASDDAPTLARGGPVTPERAHVFVPFSYEVEQDWGQLSAELTRLIQESKDDLEADKFVTGAGSGSDEPEGVVAGLAGSSKFESATANTFAAEDVYELDNKLPERFRPRARFLANKVIYNDVRQFASSDGHDLWVRLGEGLPPTILGYPAHESSAMDSDSTADLDEILLLGDFRHFLIVDRVGMSVELVPHVFGSSQRPTGEKGVYAFWRNSSAILADEAFQLLQVNDGS